MWTCGIRPWQIRFFYPARAKKSCMAGLRAVPAGFFTHPVVQSFVPPPFDAKAWRNFI
jgi:hypothetical protein